MAFVHGVGSLLLAVLAAPPGTVAKGDVAPLVFVEAQAGCLVAAQVRAKLADVVVDHPGAEALTVTASDVAARMGTRVSLRVVTPLGEVILERHFELAPADCRSSPLLLATVLQTFLTEVPRTRWGIEKPADESTEVVPVVVERDASELGGMLSLGVDSRWLPTGAGLEAGAAIDVGSSRHRLTGSAAVRLGWPQALGSGHFLDATALLGVGWRYGGAHWLVRAEARAGGIWVAGYGFAKDRQVWLPWVEGQLCALWTVGPLLLGPELGLSPLRHLVTTSAGAPGRIPWLRLGVAAAWPLWSKKI